jgi:hypothetical protein
VLHLQAPKKCQKQVYFIFCFCSKAYFLQSCQHCYKQFFFQTTLFKTLTSCRSTTKQICKVKRDRKFGRGESITWFCDQLVIPPVPPSCLIGCNIISIKYTLEVSMLYYYIQQQKTTKHDSITRFDSI